MNSKQLLSKLAETTGPMSVSGGVLWFEDGTSIDLTALATNAAAGPIVITVRSESLGQIALISPECMNAVDADALATKASTAVQHGQPRYLNDALPGLRGGRFHLDNLRHSRP